jgi:hypothetical protein
MGLECLTVIFNHLPKEQMLKHYEFHKERMSNVRVVWDIKDIPPEQFEDPKNPEILPMELNNLWSDLVKYYTMSLTWFIKEKPEYFILMERDAVVVSKDFERKIIDYMKEHKVGVAFPWLDSRWTNPGHMFSQALQGIDAKQWTIPALTVIKWEALQYYGQSLVHLPDYWGEIRFPSVLANAGFQVIANPFTTNKYFFSPNKAVPEEQRSMEKELIAEGMKAGWKAMHPIKNYDLLDFIKSEEEKNEKEPN